MASPTITTFQDAVEHLLDRFNLPRAGRNLRLARGAVVTAYRDLPTRHRWSYYLREQQFATVPVYSTGTVAYDHTGGAHERLLTLSGGTWPSYAAAGRLIINQEVYVVDERKSDTTLTLTESSNPGEDVASTTYQWYQDDYPLEVSFRRASPMVELATSSGLQHLQPDQILDYLQGNYAPSDPLFYCFHGNGKEYGRMYVRFAPPPNTAKTYRFMAEISPRPLVTEKYSDGLVSTSGTTVTGTDTLFTSNHVGAILRFSADGEEEPTGLMGSPGDGLRGDGVYNPFTAQRRIMAVTSSTVLRIDSALPSELTSVKFTISDPVDMDDASMATLMTRMSEAEFASRCNDVSAEETRTLQALATTQLLLAMGADNRNKDMNDGRRWSPQGLDDLDTGTWTTVQ